jgi:hypothetical protein
VDIAHRLRHVAFEWRPLRGVVRVGCLNPPKGIEESDFKVCADCITNTVTYVLRATYHSPNNGGVTVAVKHLLGR